MDLPYYKNDVELQTHVFPKLAILFLEKQDLKGLSAADLHEKFWKTYHEICFDYEKKREGDFFENLFMI